MTSSPDSSAPKGAGSRTNVFVVAPEKIVGNPVHVSQQPIAFTDVSWRVGLSDLGAQSVVLVDDDLDGWPDITANTYEGLVIYRNVGGTFMDGTAQIVDGDPKQLKWSTGLVYADLDGDGDLYFYAAQMGARDQILLNDGQGRLQLSSTNGLPDSTST